MKEYVDIAQRRKSVRKYNGVNLTMEELAQVEGRLGELKPLIADISVEYEIVPCKETNCSFNGEYCLLCYSEQKPRYRENAGYLLEQWELTLQEMGIGVCWYGFGRAEEKQRNGKVFVIMLCFGKCDQSEFRTDLTQYKRKNVEELFVGVEPAVAELSHLAPSACNSQPWRVEQTEEGIVVYQQKSKINPMVRILSRNFNKIDMGIFMVFLEMALEQNGHLFDREILPEENCTKEKIAQYILR